MSIREIEKRLRVTQPAVSIAASRGMEIAAQNWYSLFDKKLFIYLWASPFSHRREFADTLDLSVSTGEKNSPKKYLLVYRIGVSSVFKRT